MDHFINNLDKKRQEQFTLFFELLMEWNKFMNLTTITEYDEVVTKHFIDSVSIERAVDMNNIQTVIDVGTGAGFPGIPLKIMYPQLKITLLDSLNKRVKFLNKVIEKLQLDDVQVQHGRAEDYAKKKDYRENYELCVSRAVANLSTLAEYCIPYVKTRGLFIAYKSGNIKDELDKSKRAISTLGGHIEDIVKFQLPGTDMERCLVKIRKEKSTPKKYPRKAGLPTKEPL